MSQLTKKWKELSVKLLRKADWNYKIDEDDKREKLKQNLEKNGVVVNLIVRPLESGNYEVVNGNHRLDVLEELGINSVMCCIIYGLNIEKAGLLALETNELRFENDNEKLASLLRDISQNISLEEIEATTPFNLEEIDNYINSLDLGFGSDDESDGEKDSPSEGSNNDEKEVDENIETKNTCPSCGYKW